MSDKDKLDIYDVVVLGAGDSHLIIPIRSGEGAEIRNRALRHPGSSMLSGYTPYGETGDFGR